MSAADQAVSFASETVNAANILTSNLLAPLQTTAYSVAKASADPFQSWTGFSESVVGLGRTANQTVLAGLTQRFTAGARFEAVASQMPSVTGDLVTDTLNTAGGWLDTVTGNLTVSLRSWLARAAWSTCARAPIKWARHTARLPTRRSWSSAAA